ncbi:hypothetical protein L3Y34_004213 [Caenorhabditis briggsae]|uniref:Uncharacterized protein n=2 Tax=Caenorhabditis briggsae TaxID=6238 RepID=A0AAE9A8F2_CAEBR|nr:hypothetical protein L3Y34_004213 [Caenorhabditis briggsae]
MLDEEAERLFRLECLETLNWPPCAPIPSHISKQDPSLEFHNVANNLDSLLQSIDAPANIVPKVDSNGKIAGFEEYERVVVGSANTSMSINRAPFKQKSLHTSALNSIKGSPGNVPFIPGFLEEIEEMMGNKEKSSNGGGELKYLNFSDEADLLNSVPTLGRIKIPEIVPLKKEEKEVVHTEVAKPVDTSDVFDFLNMLNSDEYTVVEKPKTSKKVEDIPIDKPIEIAEQDDNEISNLPEIVTKPYIFGEVISNKPGEKFEYARKLEKSPGEEEEYQRLMPTMARKYPFTLDYFQQSSVLCMERGESLFVAAHTSAGKTVVAEYAIALCQAHKTRAVYTSPIKALSNQKFRDFKQIFGDVGLVTGDIQLHPEAACLIMTTEILRSMLYNGSEVIRDLEWVVFDEVHYINNEERGHVWEEVLIMLPAHVKIVMLSATVPNCVEFADWVGRIKNRKINVISTDKRPVPLEHFLYTGQDGKTQRDLFKIIDRDGQFILKGYNDAKDSKTKSNEKEKAGGSGGRGGSRGGGGMKRGGGNSGGGKNWPGKNDKNIYLNLINFMKCADQLPMVIFVFSRKRCDDNAQMLSSMNLTTEVEKQHVRTFFSQCIQRLKGSDKELPQVLTMRELCLRGFAVHHSGILPILKEVVELLFQKGYVKILFATETFAMGVNMPARCVVFDSITKHDGTERRLLNPGEYTQMAGRAGRRGLDSTGTVVIICKDSSIPLPDVLKNVISGQALRLESKFRVTYSMILNLLRVEQLKIEDMLQRSYVESDSLRESKEKKKALCEMRRALEEVEPIECETCTPNSQLRDYHDAVIAFVQKRANIWPKLNDENVINKLLGSGRFLIVTSAHNQLQNECALLIKELNNKSIQVLSVSKDSEETTQKNLKAVKFSKLPKTDINWLTEENQILGTTKYGTRGVAQCPQTAQSFRLSEIPLSGIVAVTKKSIKNVQSAEILQEYNMLQIPRFRDREISESIRKLMQQITTVSQQLASKELETYSWKELRAMCQNLELSFETDWMESIESELNLPKAFPARHCTRFADHFDLLRNSVRIERKVKSLEYDLSSDALRLSDEYQNRLKVLESLGFVEKKMVSLKGRIGCEIHHQELLITELILDYKFHKRTPAELAALLSTLTCQYNCGKEVTFEPNSVFAEICESVKSVLTRLESEASKHRAHISDVGCEIRFDLMEVVYEWANGTPFYQIMEMTDCQEGLIVKCIQRLDEVCKDVRNAGRIVGDPALVEKMEEVSASIRRDIVFAASLYTTV